MTGIENVNITDMNTKLLAVGLLILSAGITDLYASNPKENRNNMEKLTLTKEWDKTFPKSDKVDHSKVHSSTVTA